MAVRIPTVGRGGAQHRLADRVVPEVPQACVLVGPVADRLRELLLAEAAERGWSVEALELMPDHVHLLVCTPPDVSAARVAHQMKGFTSNVLRSEFRHLRNIPTLWSKSYFVASVGRVSEATIRKYIGEQTTRPIREKP